MINKIAAGEVIERPASVVKELVENAIDAGATRIDVSLENGGSNLIRIVDNGCGIESDQLPLALSPHATSKLNDADDLFRVCTFGFRGEALASVAEISQLTIKSRTAKSESGAMIQSNGGHHSATQHSAIQSCGMPVGTQIEVRNLFFNTPVRRRYMKSTTTEFGHVTETFCRLVLPQPQIHFTLKHNDRTVHELPPTDPSDHLSGLARIRQLFGEEIVRDMIAIESPDSANRHGAAVRVSGFVSHPNQSRPNNRMQYFFLNRRFIRDRALQHALNEAYRGILLSGRFPLAFLQIELPADSFDVNVHPTKMEVRFLDSNRVYTGFLGAIREKFLASDLRKIQTADGRRQTAAEENAPPPWENEEPRNTLDPIAAEKKKREVEDWISHIQTGNTTKAPVFLGNKGKRSAMTDSSAMTDGRRQQNNSYSGLTIQHLSERNIDERKTGGRKPPGDVPRESLGGKPTDLRPPLLDGEPPHIIQMLNRYLVMETENGIALIDQHALHERILYEQLKEKIQSGELPSQRLLVPVPVDLSPNEFSCVSENTEFFGALGLSVEPFGGNTVLISACPAVLSKTPPEEILWSLIEPFLEGIKPESRGPYPRTDGSRTDGRTDELLDKLLHSMACKAAVKAGETLSAESIQHLIQLASAEINAHHCPHGRPSTIVLSREEIDKMFERT